MMLGEIEYEDLYYSKNSIIVNKTTNTTAFYSTQSIGKKVQNLNLVFNFYYKRVFRAACLLINEIKAWLIANFWK